MKSAWAWEDDDAPSPASPDPSAVEGPKEDRIIAALLLRDAKSKADDAAQFGTSAYFDEARMDKTVNKRLLKGEVSQARSFNRRAGVEPLPAPEASGGDTKLQREAKALEQIFVRSAHQIRESVSLATAVPEPEISTQELKKQRLGLLVRRGSSNSVDVAELERAEAQNAEDELELTNEILKPSPKVTLVTKTGKVAASLEGGRGGSSRKREISGVQSELQAEAASPVSEKSEEKADQIERVVLWPSKGMRVRVVDENGEFKKGHLKKGVVVRRHDSKGAVDVELDDEYRLKPEPGGGKLLKLVPQTKLETVVTKTCKRIEVVRGSHQGNIADLIHRDSRNNVATVRFGRGNNQKELDLPLDDVCEFI